MTNQLWIERGEQWFAQQYWQAFPFQLETWQAYLSGAHGLVNAPTGSGKTYALIIPVLLEYLREQATAPTVGSPGLRAIWITPIRALAREIQLAAQRAVDGLGLNWEVALRTGDTDSKTRSRQKEKPPQLLITTPESLHLLLATKGYDRFFAQLKTVIADEWHEQLGSKRGVQVELALSRLKTLLPDLKIWGISATIGNLDEAIEVLLGNTTQPVQVVRADMAKKVEVVSILPDEVETLPWAGHLGIKLLDKVLPIIERSRSTLIFTNTRAQCEIWYQRLLEAEPDLAGAMAMHHGSLSREIRDWVENALHDGTLKAVVCTSSLDLGVDFRPVESIVQIGSPKGVARFLQRAGRSGHQPGALSRVYFLPTHSLELLEGAALRQAIADRELESRIPHYRSFDVLVQYLCTLAVSDGFCPQQTLEEVRGTFCYRSISTEEWNWLLNFITTGGASLQAYPEYQKVEIGADGKYRITDRRTALRHRLQIGTIVSDVTLHVKYLAGGYIGTVEEWFVSQLKPGDVFWFAGRSLELVRVKDMTVQVRKSTQTKGKIPSWQGGTLPISAPLGQQLREMVALLANAEAEIPAVQLTYHPELRKIQPLIDLQKKRSQVPTTKEFLLEHFQTREGHHLLMYPFEGRFVHEGMGALFAYRIAQLQAMSFSIAVNNYGLELLSDRPIPIEQALDQGLFSTQHLRRDIAASINAAELAKRRFRDIASIAGLVFKGYPGKQKKDKHLQASSQLFFEVFSDYEPDNLLLLQAHEEVLSFQLEEDRLLLALQRINQQQRLLRQPAKPTPFAFPIMVDRWRERLSTEKLEDRIQKMKVQLEA